MEKNYEESSNTSFNMSLATLQRIDNILRRLNGELEVPGRLNSYGMTLHSINLLELLFNEVYPFLNQEERKQGFAFKDAFRNWNLNRYYSKYQPYNERATFIVLKKSGMNSPQATTLTSITDLLEDFEFWLRDQLNIKGLLMAKTDDPSLALEN